VSWHEEGGEHVSPRKKSIFLRTDIFCRKKGAGRGKGGGTLGRGGRKRVTDMRILLGKEGKNKDQQSGEKGRWQGGTKHLEGKEILETSTKGFGRYDA